MTLKENCTPRSSVFAADRRATVLNLDSFLKGHVDGDEFFEENYFTNGMVTLMDRAFRHLAGDRAGSSVFLLSQAMGVDADADSLPTRRGRNALQAAHPFACAPLRHLLFAIRETVAADNSPKPGRQYLRDTFGPGYWSLRERFISLLEWLAQLGNAAGMEEWHKDSEAARFLLGRLRNDHA
jgi:hypothetical protein